VEHEGYISDVLAQRRDGFEIGSRNCGHIALNEATAQGQTKDDDIDCRMSWKELITGVSKVGLKELVPVLGTAEDLSNSRPAMAPTCDKCYRWREKRKRLTDLFTYGTIFCGNKVPAAVVSKRTRPHHQTVILAVHAIIAAV
jgi:hypothetical protein